MNSPAPSAPAPRRNWARRAVNLLVALVVIAVAAATFVFSYDGVHADALLGGVSTRLARYYPGLFDAVLVVACVAVVVLREGRWWARLWAWLVLVVVLAAIGVTDVLHAMNYTLRHRPTEGVVAGAPVVAVLLAFSLLLTMLRQSRTREDAPQPAAVPAPLDVPALPAAVTVAAPIALPAGPVPGPVRVAAAVPAGSTGDFAQAPTREVPVVDDGPVLYGPVVARPAADDEPQDTGRADDTDAAHDTDAADDLEPAGPATVAADSALATDVAAGAGVEPAAGVESAADTVPAADASPAGDLEHAEPQDRVAPVVGVTDEDGGPDDAAAADTAPGGTAPAADEQGGPLTPPDGLPVMRRPATAPAEVIAPAEPPTAVAPTMPETAAPAPAAPPTRPSIRYAGSGQARRGKPVTAEPDPEQAPPAAETGAADYWDGQGGQYAGLVYPARDENADDEDSAATRPAPRHRAPEIDEDAPPFATAPFASIPRLNRVRSMPAPPAEDEDEDD
jgi:hypothetical protein